MENENTDIIINGSIATWIMPPTIGEILGTYSGTFQFRCWLNPTQQLEAGREYRALLGNNAAFATENDGHLAFALSTLKYRVISSPPFWNATLPESGYAGSIPDLGIIALVLDKAITAESMYKEKVKKERDALLERSISAAETLAAEGKE